MPLVGVIDPTGKEALPHPGNLPNWMTQEQLLQMLASNELGESHWTYEMAAAAIQNVQDRGDIISTTALTTSCIRGEVLKRKEDYIGDLNDLWTALRGTLIHRTLEIASPPGSISEVRFFTEVDGIEISGQPDMMTEKYLVDYKVPADQNTIPMSYLYSNQTEQLMINAFIARNATRWDPEDLPFDPRDYPVESVGIVFIGPKRPKVMVHKASVEVIGKNGKPKRVRLPVVWSDEEVLHTIRPRMHLLKNALDSYPDWPKPYVEPGGVTWTVNDLWGGDETWDCPGWPFCKFATCLAKRKVYKW